MNHPFNSKGMLRLSILLTGVYLVGLLLHASLAGSADPNHVNHVALAGLLGTPLILLVINLIPWVAAGFHRHRGRHA